MRIDRTDELGDVPPKCGGEWKPKPFVGDHVGNLHGGNAREGTHQRRDLPQHNAKAENVARLAVPVHAKPRAIKKKKRKEKEKEKVLKSKPLWAWWEVDIHSLFFWQLFLPF
jgi:hypothetical protein